MQVTIHEAAKAAFLVSGSTWVGFDLPQTLCMKIKAADALGLGGLMVGGSCRVGLAGGAGWRAGQLWQSAAVVLLPLVMLQARESVQPALAVKTSARPPP